MIAIVEGYRLETCSMNSCLYDRRSIIARSESLVIYYVIDVVITVQRRARFHSMAEWPASHSPCSCDVDSRRNWMRRANRAQQ